MSGGEIKRSLKELHEKLRRENKPANISFEQFLERMAAKPALSLRSIFQLFHDMIHYYVPEGYDEYMNDPESINYIHYDTKRLFVDDSENPFFADRLLANRLVNVADSFKSGALRNKMMVFVGPPGSGKSTFLNNLIQKLEKYTLSPGGEMYETVWHLDVEKFGLTYTPALERDVVGFNFLKKKEAAPDLEANKKLIIPCPSHDHPIIQIPKEFRRDLLSQIIGDQEFKKALFGQKEYEWVFNDSPCPVCSSIYKALCEKLSPEEILSMLYVRTVEFSRKLGDGVSVYSPGDRLMKTPITDVELQRWIDSIFKSSNEVQYIYSRMAKTNNGIFAIMDVKSENVERLRNIHGIISDGVHKVGLFEERINSLFMTLINPGDLDIINEEKSFRDRVIKIPIPYVRDYTTEVEIYRNAYGGGIDNHFMPNVLPSFAKVIIASRLSQESKAAKDWIEYPGQYMKLMDSNMQLLRMEIYCGNIPVWLTESDVKRLDRHRRRSIIMEGESEGRNGFSGRQSLEMFNSFYSRYRGRSHLVTIQDVAGFFQESERFMAKIPEGFLAALVNLYDYTVLQEIKESMFFYNQDQIVNNIFNYLFAINHDVGTEVESPFTGELIRVSEGYFNDMERLFLGQAADAGQCGKFRNDTLRKYVARTLHEVGGGRHVVETQQFQELLRMYNQNLKQNVLDPFINNDNFRMAIKDFGKDGFKKYDIRIRNEVEFLIKNLKFKFKYPEDAALQVCIYAIDKKLADIFG